MWSSRYAPAVCVVLLLALVPTIIHSYAGLVTNDGRSTATIPTSLMSYSSAPTRRSADWGERRFDSHDWFERQYTSTGDEVVLTVVRSYDLKALYHHPELAVSYQAAKFDKSRMESAEGRPDVPVRVLTNRPGGAVAMYVLHYDSRFISDPIRFQLRAAGELLFSGRKPMTLFFVLDKTTPEGVAPLNLPAAKLLFEAIDRFTAVPDAAQ
ncbi:MAG TPA: hypothetical protein VFD69_11395 [Vicinamibacterales bacterium]|nr:hypothetical protein [Vicinamibacterales bacterium]